MSPAELQQLIYLLADLIKNDPLVFCVPLAVLAGACLWVVDGVVQELSR